MTTATPTTTGAGSAGGTRPDGRRPDELRPVTITRRWLEAGEGSVLVEFGGTKVLCVASFTQGPPVGDLRESVTMTTSEPDYAWVNPLQIWARGTVDLAKGEAHVTGYVV